MPDLAPTITRIDIHTYRAAVENPVVTSFGSIPSRGTAFILLEDSDGAHGWGEIWGNFPTITTEYRAKLAGWLLPDHLLGTELTRPGAMTDAISAKLRVLRVQANEPGPVDAVLAAANQALWDLTARRAGRPLRHMLNPGAANAVPAYASGLNPDDCETVTDRCRSEGYRAFKLKIGFGAEIDQRNLTNLRAAMAEGERLFVDANQRWPLDDALRQIDMLAENGVEWFEEPMIANAPADDWRRLAKASSVPLAGGENIMTREGLEASAEWFGYIQPDIGKWGGVDGCLDIAREAIAAGRTYCPHWLSGGIGLMHSANVLAAAGGGGLLEIDSNPNPLRTVPIAGLDGVRGGDFLLPDAPGIGVEPPLDEMEHWLVGHETFS